MKIDQIYSGCLAHCAYYVQSNGEAVIIDPRNEIIPYLERARKEGASIKYIFETHFNKNTVHDHLELANKTGARIIYGPHANPTFKAHVAKDGEEFHVGNITIKLLHTPGHTLESSCFLLKDQNHRAVALFSGNTLLIGDVARPNLTQSVAGTTMEELAGHLYDSLRNKILILPDDILIYPALGAGAACAKNIGNEMVDTLGHQKKINYALRPDVSRTQFIQEITFGLLPSPHHFANNLKMHQEVHPGFEHALSQGLRPLIPNEFEIIAAESEAVLLDTRSAQKFAKGFIPKSINIGLDGTFTPWVGTLVPGVKHPILIIAENGKEAEAVTRLARVGYDNVIGYLKGGFETWEAPGRQVEKIETISASTFYERIKNQKPTIIDVRRAVEFNHSHVTGAHNVPLEYLNEHLAEIPKKEPVYLYCGNDYRAMMAASILAARGWNNLIEVAGGFKGITATDTPRTESHLIEGKVKSH